MIATGFSFCFQFLPFSFLLHLLDVYKLTVRTLFQSSLRITESSLQLKMKAFTFVLLLVIACAVATPGKQQFICTIQWFMQHNFTFCFGQWLSNSYFFSSWCKTECQKEALWRNFEGCPYRSNPWRWHWLSFHQGWS